MRIEDILTQVAARFSGERARELVEELWARDRWFDFAHFRRSASYAVEKMAEAGLGQVQIISFAADGRTAYGDWVAPLAWDVASAELQIRSPQPLALCSYVDLPVSLAMWMTRTLRRGRSTRSRRTRGCGARSCLAAGRGPNSSAWPLNMVLWGPSQIIMPRTARASRRGRRTK
jgi:hypothetical protein